MFFKKKKEQSDTLEERFTQSKSAIYPILRPAYTVKIQESEKGVELKKLYQPFLEEIDLFYQIDRGDFWEVIIENNIPEQVIAEEIDEIAKQNLLAVFKCELILSTRFLGYEVFAEEDITASALLIDNLWKNASQRLGADLIVAVPARNTLLFVEGQKAEVIDQMHDLALAIYEEQGKMQLSKRLYKYDRGAGSFSLYR